MGPTCGLPISNRSNRRTGLPMDSQVRLHESECAQIIDTCADPHGGNCGMRRGGRAVLPSFWYTPLGSRLRKYGTGLFCAILIVTAPGALVSQI